MPITPEIARSVMEVLTGSASKYDMRADNSICVSDTYDVSVRPMMAAGVKLNGVIDGLKEINDKVSKIQETFSNMGIDMTGSDNQPYIYTAPLL